MLLTAVRVAERSRPTLSEVAVPGKADPDAGALEIAAEGAAGGEVFDLVEADDESLTLSEPNVDVIESRSRVIGEAGLDTWVTLIFGT